MQLYGIVYRHAVRNKYMKNSLIALKQKKIILCFLCFIGQIYGNSFMRRIDDYFLSDIQSDDLRLVSIYCKPNSTCIAVLIDRKNKKFILKQKISHPLSSILEKLATDIAYSVNISANLVRMIPCNFSFIGKGDENLPATFHTFVPGIQARHLPKHLHKYLVSLRQIINEGEPDPNKKICGFTKELVQYMSRHNDLPKIVALDTFLADHDRNIDNFFYDEKTDHFFVIDFEGAFRRNVAEYVYQSFLTMSFDKNFKFSLKEIKGLILYRDMLNKLVNTYNPASLYAYMDELLQRAQLSLTEKKIMSKRALYNKIIEENYNSCKKIIGVLNILLKTQVKSYIETYD